MAVTRDEHVIPGGPAIASFANHLADELEAAGIKAKSAIKKAVKSWEEEQIKLNADEIDANPPVVIEEVDPPAAPPSDESQRRTEKERQDDAREWLREHPQELPKGGIEGNDL